MLAKGKELVETDWAGQAEGVLRQQLIHRYLSMLVLSIIKSTFDF